MSFDAEVGERVLDAALPQFAERGYENTTLGAIGLAVGLERGHVEALFTSKAALFARLVDRELQRRRRDVIAAVPTDADGASPGSAVAAALDGLLARMRQSGASWRLLLHADPGSFGEVEAGEELRATLRARLAWLVASAAPLSPDDRRVVASVLAALVAALVEVSVTPLLAGAPVLSPAEVGDALDRLLAPGDRG